MAEENKTGGVDREAQEAMNAKVVELAVSDEKQFRRTELNFYAEFYSQLLALNKALEEFNTTVAELGADKLTAFFKEVSDNVKKEEKRAAAQRRVRQSHLPKSK